VPLSLKILRSDILKRVLLLGTQGAALRFPVCQTAFLFAKQLEWPELLSAESKPVHSPTATHLPLTRKCPGSHTAHTVVDAAAQPAHWVAVQPAKVNHKGEDHSIGR
jgi:hypothetical protein